MSWTASASIAHDRPRPQPRAPNPDSLPLAAAAAHKDALLSGALLKQSDYVKAWRERYFVLLCNPPRLLYYTDKKEKRPKKKIDLQDAKVEAIHIERPALSISSTFGKTYLASDDPAAIDTWIKQLRWCITNNTNNNINQHAESANDAPITASAVGTGVSHGTGTTPSSQPLTVKASTVTKIASLALPPQAQQLPLSPQQPQVQAPAQHAQSSQQMQPARVPHLKSFSSAPSAGAASSAHSKSKPPLAEERKGTVIPLSSYLHEMQPVNMSYHYSDSKELKEAIDNGFLIVCFPIPATKAFTQVELTFLPENVTVDGDKYRIVCDSLNLEGHSCVFEGVIHATTLEAKARVVFGPDVLFGFDANTRHPHQASLTNVNQVPGAQATRSTRVH